MTVGNLLYLLSDQTNKRPISNLISGIRSLLFSLILFAIDDVVIWHRFVGISQQYFLRHHFREKERLSISITIVRGGVAAMSTCRSFRLVRQKKASNWNGSCFIYWIRYGIMPYNRHHQTNFIHVEKYNQKSNFEFYCYTHCDGFTAHNNKHFSCMLTNQRERKKKPKL